MTRFPLAAFVILCAVHDALAQDIRATVDGAPKRLALSASVRLTLALEGPAPLRVELPQQLLTADANGIWGVSRPGPVEREPVGGGRERWSRTYQLTPFPPVEGDAAGKRTASFAPVKVNGQSVTWPPFEVEVTSSVGTAAPPHGLVGVEDPVIVEPDKPRSSAALWAVVAVGCAGVCVLIAVRSRRRRGELVPPYEAAVAALTQLGAADAPGAEAVERVATVLRTFVERRFAIPATKLTTAELLAAAREQGWAVEQTDALGLILDQCDRAKFAGDVPDNDGCRGLIRRAVDWLDDVGRPAEPR
jgi:hypothetical protein